MYYDKDKPTCIYFYDKFYDKAKDYYWLTNFSDDSKPIKVDGNSYKTTEHYFQAQKFKPKSTIRKNILKAESASDAFRIANENSKSTSKLDKDDWVKEVRPGLYLQDHLMLKALMAKFADPARQEQLITTGEAILVEDSPHDNQWGVGADGKGRNKLGLMLMAESLLIFT